MTPLGPIAVIGTGNLGGALVRGLVKSGKTKPADIVVSDRAGEKRTQLARELGVTDAPDGATAVARVVAKGNATVVLAVKPQDIEKTIAELHPSFTHPALFISVAAGVRTEFYSSRLPSNVQITRAMPNLPSLIGHGMTGLYSAGADLKVAEEIFSTMGRVAVFDKESDLDAVIAVSASGVGFMFLILDAMVEGGVKLGLTPEEATLLAAQTFSGAGAMVLETGETPAALYKRVASPAGTTMAGAAVMEQAGFRDTLIATMEASVRRSIELGKK